MPGDWQEKANKARQDAKSKKEANKEKTLKTFKGMGRPKIEKRHQGTKRQGMFRQEILEEEGQRRQNDS